MSLAIRSLGLGQVTRHRKCVQSLKLAAQVTANRGGSHGQPDKKQETVYMKTTILRFRNSLGSLLAAVTLVAISPSPPLQAAGLLIADGGLGGVLEIKEHDVQVTINNGIAVTKVTQVFHNTEKRQVEALYTFPVPKGASVANFSMWINGKEMVGEVLEKQRAREIYNSYKQVRRDPGLLEQVDYRTFEMRIFPIGPEADQKVQITYYQELDYDHDTATYVYPLATVTRKGVDARTTGKFAIGFDVKSAVPIVELESPSHGNAFAVAKHSDAYWQANLEANGGSLAQDVVLACRVARPQTGMDLHHLEARRRGRFLLPDADRRPGRREAAGQHGLRVRDGRVRQHGRRRQTARLEGLGCGLPE